jgi:hypothetical protein
VKIYFWINKSIIIHKKIFFRGNSGVFQKVKLFWKVHILNFLYQLFYNDFIFIIFQEKLLSKLEESELEAPTSQEDECVICISSKATMQTMPCGHQVLELLVFFIKNSCRSNKILNRWCVGDVLWKRSKVQLHKGCSHFDV